MKLPEQDETRSTLWEHIPGLGAPQMFPAEFEASPGIQAVFYEGLPYKGKETRVFALYSVPETASGEPVPGIVLVHGGGGTAFEEWVKLWNGRGYAAIAVDLEGNVPVSTKTDAGRTGHAMSGPKREGIFLDCAEPLEDQWMVHAAANVMLAYSLLASLPGVDAGRIGMTGISWGGIVVSLVSGVDERFAFAIPVYGCGYLYEAQNQWGARFAEMGEADAREVKSITEPSAYFARVRLPMLWVNGLQDPHFTIELFSKSYAATRGGDERTALCIHPKLGHSHPLGWQPPEIAVFADSIVCGGEPLLRLSEPSETEQSVTLGYSGNSSAARADLWFTRDTGIWPERQWQSESCSVDSLSRIVHAILPSDTAAYLIVVFDERGYAVSTPAVPRHLA